MTSPFEQHVNRPNEDACHGPLSNFGSPGSQARAPGVVSVCVRGGGGGGGVVGDESS